MIFGSGYDRRDTSAIERLQEESVYIIAMGSGPGEIFEAFGSTVMAGGSGIHGGGSVISFADSSHPIRSIPNPLPEVVSVATGGVRPFYSFFVPSLKGTDYRVLARSSEVDYYASIVEEDEQFLFVAMPHLTVT